MAHFVARLRVVVTLRACGSVVRPLSRPFVSAVPLPSEDFVSSNPYGLSDKSPSLYQSQLAPICGQVWRKYRDQGLKRYQDAPPEGVSVVAEYYDNAVHVGTNTDKTVLMLHGTPGNYQHFSPLIDHLTKRGVRVIAPNFPTIELSKRCKWFRHSPEEKLEYVKSLMANVGVRHVDALISHSSAIYTAVNAWQDPEAPEVKSLVLLNPCGLDVLVPMRPEWAIRWLVKTYESDIGSRFLDTTGRLIVTLLRNAFATSTIQDSIWGATANHYTPRQQLSNILPVIKRSQMPITLVYSDVDRVMSNAMSKKVLELVGASEANADIYDKNSQLTEKGMDIFMDGSKQPWLKVVLFKSGGHFSFLKHTGVVCDVVSGHLDRLK